MKESRFKKIDQSLSLLKNEILRNMKIVLRGPSRLLLVISLIFPITYLLFMNLVFGLGITTFNYPMAVVVPDYESSSALEADLNQNKLPNLEEFLDYLDNNDLVGSTIVKSHVEAIGYSEEEFLDQMLTQDIVLIVVLPEDFDNIIQDVKEGTWNGGKVVIELICLNINEDYLKNLYFGFQRKLKAYYDEVFENEVEVDYVYKDAAPNRQTFPRMWTIGVGAIGFVCLTASMVISSVVIFIEKNSRMRAELALSSSLNQVNVYTGKIIASTMMTILINFPLGALIIFSWISLPFPQDFFTFTMIIIGTILLGSILGSLLGALIPDQVFTFPIAMFLVLASLFLCGGFISIQMFGEPLKSIVSWIPFTYCFAIINDSVLTGSPPPINFIIGLIGYLILCYLLGLVIFKKFVISKG